MSTLPAYVIDAGIEASYIEKRQKDISGQHRPILLQLGVDLNILCKQPNLYFDTGINQMQMHRVCSWYGKFSASCPNPRNLNEIHQSILSFSQQMRDWPSSNLQRFGKWMGLKSLSNKQPILHIQLLDRLLGAEFKPASLSTIKNHRSEKDDNFLVVESNLRVMEKYLGSDVYRNRTLRMASTDSTHLEMAEKLNGFLNKDSIDFIIQNLVNAPIRDADYVDVVTMKIVPRKRVRIYEEVLDDYLIVSNDKTSFDQVVKQMKTQISCHARSGKAMVSLITETLQTGSYVNLDSRRVVKSPIRGKLVDTSYRVLANDRSTIDYYLAILKKYPSIIPRKIKSPRPVRSSRKNKRKAIPSAVRYQVWRHAFDGKMDGECFSCQCPITFENWDCGHIKAHCEGGTDTADNLRPLCRQCNVSMGKENMFEWMKHYEMPGYWSQRDIM